MKIPANHPLHLVLGQAIWLGWLGAAYGALSVACLVAPPAVATAFNLLNAALLLLTVAVAAVLAWAAWTCWHAAARARHQQEPALARFVPRASAWLYGAAAVSMLVTGLPLLVVPPCV